jgi:hypothetical protein
MRRASAQKVNNPKMTKLKTCFKNLLVFLGLFLVAGTLPSFSQVPVGLPNENRVYDKKIRTVLLYKEGFEMSAPVMNLSAGEQLKLSFDELDPDLKRFRYTIRHCEADWKTSSELQVTDYIDGFQDDAINDFAYSFNTTTNYTHYSLVFPTSNLRPKLSGNYIIIVFMDDPSNVMLTWRFMVTENTRFSILGGNARQVNNVSDRFTKQQVDFTLEFGSLSVGDPSREIKVVITQNDRWDNAVRGIPPRVPPSIIPMTPRRCSTEETNTGPSIPKACCTSRSGSGVLSTARRGITFICWMTCGEIQKIM